MILGNGIDNMSDRKSAERKRRERDRMRDAGFVIFQTYVHADDLAKVRKNTKRLREKRTGESEE